MADNEDFTNRIEWRELPRSARNAVERRLGSTIRSATTQKGGFSHGVAARLELSDGRTVFAKAIDNDDALVTMYRTEAETAARLPRTVPAPAVQASINTAGWLITIFDDVEGRHPRLEQPIELAAVLAVVERLAELLTPSPLPDAPTIADEYGPELIAWRQFAEHGPPSDLDEWSLRHLDRLAELETMWCEAAAGETLLHTDLRPDNMLLRSDGSVVVVDWAWPCRGATWVDLVSLAPSIAASVIDPDPILATHPTTRDTDPAAISAFVCALTGYWERNSRRPALPRSPKLRRYQAHAAYVSTEWLSRRLGWQ
ncbi:phosphotransferase [Nocardia sp. KC 131]|uniref:phosphotransferase n=1 Tax=Nocardia arseniciresistens TaxID=3392119 RepID=UPI00398F1A44